MRGGLLGMYGKKPGLYYESLSADDRSLELDPVNIGVWINRAKTWSCSRNIKRH